MQEAGKDRDTDLLTKVEAECTLEKKDSESVSPASTQALPIKQAAFEDAFELPLTELAPQQSFGMTDSVDDKMIEPPTVSKAAKLLIEDDAAAADSPPVTIRLSFSIEPHTVASADDAAFNIASNEHNQQDEAVNEDLDAFSDASSVMVLSDSLPPDHDRALEGKTSQPAGLSKQELELIDGDESSFLDSVAEEADQMSRTGSEAEHFQLHISKYVEPESDDLTKAYDSGLEGISAELDLELEGVSAKTSTEDEKHPEVEKHDQLSGEAASMPLDRQQEISQAAEDNRKATATAEREEKSPRIAELLGAFNASEIPGESTKMISIQSPKHLHPDVHVKATTDKESQPPLHVSSEEAEGKELDNTAADRSKATLMEEEETGISLGSIAEQDGEAMLAEILQLEAAEEDATQEMTVSQKRVTFQLPGKTFAGNRLALVNDPFCRKEFLLICLLLMSSRMDLHRLFFTLLAASLCLLKDCLVKLPTTAKPIIPYFSSA